MKFKEKQRCIKCSAEREYISFHTIMIHIPFKYCRNCGNHGDKAFHTVYERWISKTIWYKPQTWLNGYYEDHEGNPVKVE